MDRFQEFLEQIGREHPRASSGKPEYGCQECKDIGFIIHRDPSGKEFAIRCRCHAVSQARKIIERSGISAEFQKKTFDNFDTRNDGQLASAKNKAVQYVRDFGKAEHARHNSIIFCGQVGAGKTHLGMAICSELMRRGIAVVYMAYRDAVTRIKQNITDEKNYSRELNQYSTARVIYIDDLLKGKLTESDVNIMYEIVNYRYMNNLPIIISTEKSLEDLIAFDEATGSRIIEMCRRNIVQFQGIDLNYRLS